MQSGREIAPQKSVRLRHETRLRLWLRPAALRYCRKRKRQRGCVSSHFLSIEHKRVPVFL